MRKLDCFGVKSSEISFLIPFPILTSSPREFSNSSTSQFWLSALWAHGKTALEKARASSGGREKEKRDPITRRTRLRLRASSSRSQLFFAREQSFAPIARVTCARAHGARVAQFSRGAKCLSDAHCTRTMSRARSVSSPRLSFALHARVKQPANKKRSKRERGRERERERERERQEKTEKRERERGLHCCSQERLCSLHARLRARWLVNPPISREQCVWKKEREKERVREISVTGIFSPMRDREKERMKSSGCDNEEEVKEIRAV